MKPYKLLKEEIGLTTGAGIANYDPLFQNKPPKRKSIFEALGICEACLKPMIMDMKEGKLICKTCN